MRLIQLEALAHNVLTWARDWLSPHYPKIARLGVKRLARDVFQMDGLLIFGQSLDRLQVALNLADPSAKEVPSGLAPLLARHHVTVTVGET